MGRPQLDVDQDASHPDRDILHAHHLLGSGITGCIRAAGHVQAIRVSLSNVAAASAIISGVEWLRLTASPAEPSNRSRSGPIRRCSRRLVPVSCPQPGFLHSVGVTVAQPVVTRPAGALRAARKSADRFRGTLPVP